jgi:hypothetical protein
MHTSQKRPHTAHYVQRALLVVRAHFKRDAVSKHVKEGIQACTKHETWISLSKHNLPYLRHHLYHPLMAEAFHAPHRHSCIYSVLVQSLREGEHHTDC